MQKKLIAMTAVLCVTASVCFAQNAKTGTDVKKEQSVKPEMPKMPEIDPKSWDFLPEIIATVGNTKITKAELIRVSTPQVKMMMMMGQKLTADDYKKLAKGVAQELVKTTIVENLAADAGYKVTPTLENEVYAKFIDNMKKQMPDSKNFNFEDMIKKQGLTVADVKKQMAEGEVIQKWVSEKIIPQIAVSDAEVKTYYDKNKETFFKKPETFTASHILFKPKDTSEKAWADAKATAEKAYKDISDKQVTFEDAVKKYSEGPSKDNGGQLGTFSKGQMVPEFEAACSKIVQNDMKGYELTKTQFGWHIIKVTGHDKGGIIPFDSKLSEQIKERLKQEAVFKKINDMIDAQMKKLNPVIDIK